ncbi:hypothetical protein PPYC2_00330 [Paenibacillus polymyxa]|uniref:hypothetical protein n=1 Tax=Paenibacillus polymyxa TaxID=1406 RepID=UPI0008FB23CE|nr:hypothetical protein [Paenibacillus polymyxa]APB73558.1 hypothetical protein PPYC2_00330 [Paenibacillus polymyxa]
MNQIQRIIQALKLMEEGLEVNLMFFEIPIIYNLNPLYFIVGNDEGEELSDCIWIQVDKELIKEQIEDSIQLKQALDKQKGSVIISDKSLISGIDILAKVKSFVVPTKEGASQIKGFEALAVNKSKESDKWKRGNMTVVTNDNSFIEMNDRLRQRISSALLPYANTPVFSYLQDKITRQFVGVDEERLFIIECENCSKLEVYHIVELVNNICDPNLCRSCGDARFDSLMNVPFSETMLINAYSQLSSLLTDYVHVGKQPPENLLEDVLQFTRLDHRLEMGVALEYLRNVLKPVVQSNRFALMNKLNTVINKAKHHVAQFGELLKSIDQMTTLQSLQSTTDVAQVYNDIESTFDQKALGFYFPHPLLKNDNANPINIEDVYKQKFTNVINLYKDLFDLTGDHLLLSNLGKIIKGEPFNPDYITKELYGKALVDKTLKNVKRTELELIIRDVYDSKMRNAIAHPGRFVDPVTGEVTVFDRGEVTYKISWKEFLSAVEKLVDLHMELNGVRYRLGMEKDKNFLATGGILSFEPEIYETEEGQPVPHIIINQLYCFKDFSPVVTWWAESLKVEIVWNEDEPGIRFSINRPESCIGLSPAIRESIYGISPHTREWMELAIEQREINVTHRYCHYPVDVTERADEFNWIPINIPVDHLQTELEYFIQVMNSGGTISLNAEMLEQMRKSLVPKKSI